MVAGGPRPEKRGSVRGFPATKVIGLAALMRLDGHRPRGTITVGIPQAHQAPLHLLRARA